MADPTPDGTFGLRERIALFTVTGSAGLLATGLVYPAYSSVTRWRAHHVPLSSSNESGNGLKALGNLSKIFYKNHGWRDLYRGYGTGLLTYGIIFSTNLVANRFLSINVSSEGKPALKGWLVAIAAHLLALPLEILADRMAIFGGKVGTLMTSEEKRSPLKHVFTPSLIISGCATTWIDASVSLIETALGMSSRLEKPSRTAVVLRTAAVAVISTVFNVIFARLSASPLASIGQHSVSRPGRPNVEYYTGFLDCAERLVKEEGIGALFRGWYFEVAAAVFQASTSL